MKLFEYLDRISRIHHMVENGSTGSPNEFAGRLGVSRTSLYEMIDELRSRGAPILYSKAARTFYYSEPFDVSVSCSFRSLSEKETKQVAGGLDLYSRVLFFRTMVPEFSRVSLPC
jgi:predicted DNA-binding transcriptional regulator YafY